MNKFRKHFTSIFFVSCVSIGGLVGYYIKPFDATVPARVVNFENKEFSGSVVSMISGKIHYLSDSGCSLTPTYFTVRPVVKDGEKMIWNLGEIKQVNCADPETQKKVTNAITYSEQVTGGIVVSSEIEWKRKINRLRRETYHKWLFKKESEQNMIKVERE